MSNDKGVKIEDKLYSYLQLRIHGYSAEDSNKIIDNAVKKLESGDKDE